MNVRDYTDGQSVPAAGLAVLLGNVPVVVLFVILTGAMSVAGGLSGADRWVPFFATIFLEMLVWVLLAVAVFSTILLNTGGFKSLKAGIVFGVFWRDTALMLLSAVGGWAVWILATIVYRYSTGAVGQPDGSGDIFGIAAVVYAYSFLVYGFLGSWLVAVVAGGDHRFSAAFARGERVFERTFVQIAMFAGPFALLMAASYAFGGDDLFGSNGGIQWNFVAGSVAAAMFECFVTAMVAVILARVYVDAEERFAELPEDRTVAGSDRGAGMQ